MIVNEISLVIKNIRVLMSYFPEEDFTREDWMEDNKILINTIIWGNNKFNNNFPILYTLSIT